MPPQPTGTFEAQARQLVDDWTDYCSKQDCLVCPRRIEKLAVALQSAYHAGAAGMSQKQQIDGLEHMINAYCPPDLSRDYFDVRGKPKTIRGASQRFERIYSNWKRRLPR